MDFHYKRSGEICQYKGKKQKKIAVERRLIIAIIRLLVYNKGDYTGKREGFALQQEIVGIGAANVDIMGESAG